MHKRGLSDVVTTVLIILISLVAVAIVWQFVKPLITNSLGNGGDTGGAGSSLVDCFGMDLKVISCEGLGNGDYRVGVKRGKGEGNLDTIRFLFETNNGPVSVDQKDSLPGQFESGSFILSLGSNAVASEVDAGVILEGGSVCRETGLPVNCFEEASGGNNGGDTGGDSGGSGNGFLPLTYCAPEDLAPGTNSTIIAAYKYIDATYPVGSNSGVQSTPQVSTYVVNGKSIKRVTFNFEPFQDRYIGAPFQSNWVAQAVVYVPDPATSPIINNSLVVSIQPGTSGGNTPAADPVRGGSEIPSWYVGTEDQTNFQASFGSVVADMNVPMVFYGIVPASDDGSRYINFTPTVRQELNSYFANEESIGYTCDDLKCEGDSINHRIWEEGNVHQCLNALSRTGLSQKKYLYNHPAVYYAVATGRLINATQGVLNQVAVSANWRNSNNQVYTFKIDTVVAMGGSKRGAGMEKIIITDERIKAGLIGHANAGNYVKLQVQRRSLWTHYPADVHDDALDEINFAQTNPSYWTDVYDPINTDPALYVGKQVVRSFGTTDTYFAQGVELLFSNNLPVSARLLALPNYGHGFGTIDHAVMFRSLVNYTLTNQQSAFLQVNAKYYLDQEKVKATVTGTNDFSNVRTELWCTKGDLEDVRSRTNWAPTLSTRNNCIDLENTDPDFDPTAPDMRYSYLDKIVMTDMGGGNYEADVNQISGLGWANGNNMYIGCYVRAVKGGAAKDVSVATSYFLMNDNLCSAGLLQLKQG